MVDPLELRELLSVAEAARLLAGDGATEQRSADWRDAISEAVDDGRLPKVENPPSIVLTPYPYRIPRAALLAWHRSLQPSARGVQARRSLHEQRVAALGQLVDQVPARDRAAWRRAQYLDALRLRAPDLFKISKETFADFWQRQSVVKLADKAR